MEKRCSFCEQLSPNLRSCTGCYKVAYCSHFCQLAHWKKEHRNNCKNKRDSIKFGVCANCFTEGEVKTCSNCKVDTYCSIECQKESWPRHRKICKEMAKERLFETLLSEQESVGYSCQVCESTDGLQICTSCRSVYYCSRQCQKIDWPHHKIKCRPQKQKQNENVSQKLKQIENESDKQDQRESRSENWEPKDSRSEKKQENESTIVIPLNDNKSLNRHEAGPVTVNETVDQPVISYSTCNFCHQESDNLRRCAGCYKVFYCSEGCQKSHWKKEHKYTCVSSKSTPLQTDKHFDSCSNCGLKGEMKSCQNCKTQKYCSITCQKQDWSSHKLVCKKTSQQKPSDDINRNSTKLPVCNTCKTPNSFQVCSRCKIVYYCSKDCQKTDWPSHRHVCLSSDNDDKGKESLSAYRCSLLGLTTPEENKGANPNDRNTENDADRRFFMEKKCTKCRVNDGTMKCSQCKSTWYCSRKCESDHKKDHQDICRIISSKLGISEKHGYAAEVYSGGSSSNEAIVTFESSPPHSRLYENQMFEEDEADLNLIMETNTLQRKKAKEIIKTLLPNMRIIVRLREIPEEQKSPYNLCQPPNNVFVAYIRRFHNYRGRHCIYLQDSERREIYVAFYLKDDNPSPYFEWKDIVPGKFLAIKFPVIHFFMDKSVGLRVDDARYVICFKVTEK